MMPSNTTQNPDGEEHYFVGVDVGTGSARACVVDNDGNLLSTCSRDTRTWRSNVGCYEQSTRDIWKSICGAVRAAVAQANVPKSSIRGIAFAATCSLAVFKLDENDNQNGTEPVSVALTQSEESPDFDHAGDHNVILWMHNVAVEEAQLINATNHPILEHLGGSVSPLMALAKVLWLKKHMAPETSHRCRFFDLHDALGHIATGGKTYRCGPLCRHASQKRGFGIDGTIKGWDPGLLEQVGLSELLATDSQQIGGVCEHGQAISTGSAIGSLCHQSAGDLDLPVNVLVGSGVIDCYAGWVGTVGAQIATLSSNLDFNLQERLALVAGTSACHVLASARSDFVKGVWGPYHNFLFPGAYAVVGGQSAVGHLLQHVLDNHPAINEARSLAHGAGKTIFDFLNDHLRDIQANTNAPNLTYLARHVFFYGDHFGNRSPIADSSMTGSVIGLTGDTSLENLCITYLAAMESLALQTRHIISTMQGSGHSIRTIFMSGSLCKNALFVDLLSTICDMPVVLPEYTQAAVCYGSALIAATSVRSPSGESGDVREAMQLMSKPGKAFLPVQDKYMKDLLEVKYTIFLEQANRQRVFRQMIDEVPQGKASAFSKSD